MKAHDSYLTSLLKLSDAVFNIPVYQRNYDWDTENCEQLFYDIQTIAQTGKDHFIGSIVYISIGTATEPYFNIIDGQQRITSIMLFLRALFDATDDPKLKKLIRNVLINMGLDDVPKMKLKQVESDSSVYEKLILADEFHSEAFTDKEKASHVYKNYSHFRSLIDTSKVSLSDLYQAVFKLEIIDVRLTTEDPQEVFESMNSTGKSLTNTDLLRNYLLMDLTHSEQENLYKKYWSKIEANVSSKMVDIYMVHFLIMKRKSDSINLHKRRSKINKGNLYECFKRYFTQENKRNGETEDLLSEMYRYSVEYKLIVSPDTGTELGRAVHEAIYELNAESLAIFLMYLFHIQVAEHISDTEMLEAVHACISYIFRVRLFKGSVGNQFFALAIQYYERADKSKPFIEKIWDALTSGQGSYRFPKNSEFVHALETRDISREFKPQMLQYILYKYERMHTKEIVEPERATVEHIMPQNTDKWISHLLAIKDTNYRDNIHKIGNLTLTKMNGELSNKPFAEKRSRYRDSGYFITREIAKLNDWSSKSILERSKKMASEALLLWPLPEKYDSEVSGSENQYDMDDHIEDLFEQVVSGIREYFPDIREERRKHYVNFMRGKKTILSVIPNQSFLAITLNAPKSTLTSNDELEDVSEKGHLGIGDSRMKISTDDKIWQILEYIQQMIDGKI